MSAIETIEFDEDSVVSFTLDLGYGWRGPTASARQILAWMLGGGIYPSCLAPGYVPRRLVFRSFQPVANPEPVAPGALAGPDPGPYADITIARIAASKDPPP